MDEWNRRMILGSLQGWQGHHGHYRGRQPRWEWLLQRSCEEQGGGDWRDKARDRELWRSMEADFVEFYIKETAGEIAAEEAAEQRDATDNDENDSIYTWTDDQRHARLLRKPRRLQEAPRVVHQLLRETHVLAMGCVGQAAQRCR